MKTVFDEIERSHPDLIRAVYPNRYEVPGGYPSPKRYAMHCLDNLIVANISHNQQGVLDPIVSQDVLTTLRLVDLKVPTFFVDRDFCEAVAQTKIPTDFRLGAIHWPIDAMLLCLHQDFVRDFCDGMEFPFIGMCHFHPGRQLFTSKFCQRYTIHLDGITQDRMTMMFPLFASDEPAIFGFTYPASETIGEVFSDTKFKNYAPELKKEDNEEQVVQRLKEFGLKLLLSISTRKNFIQHGALLRKPHEKHGKPRPGLWAPSWIGRGYRRKVHGGSATGTGGTKRWHWVLGHFTYQPKGKRADLVSVASLPHKADGDIDWTAVDKDTQDRFWRSHEHLWIEPYQVNAPEE